MYMYVPALPIIYVPKFISCAPPPHSYSYSDVSHRISWLWLWLWLSAYIGGYTDTAEMFLVARLYVHVCVCMFMFLCICICMYIVRFCSAYSLVLCVVLG